MKKLLLKAKLSQKLLSAFLLIGILPACFVGISSLNQAEKALKEEGKNRLIGARDNKRLQLEQYFDTCRTDLQVLVNNVAVLKQEAFQKLDAIRSLRTNAIEDYINRTEKDIEHSAGSKECLDFFRMFKTYHDQLNTGETDPLDVSTDAYKEIWQQCDRYWKQYVEQLGFHDVYMICTRHGHVLYTHERKSDLGENLRYGKTKNEGLANLYELIVRERKPCIADFEPYSPDGGIPVAFVGAPVFDETGQLVGIFALQIRTDQINRIVQGRTGMGSSGETYIMGRHEGIISFRSAMLTMGDGKYKVGYEITTPYIERAIESQQPFDDIYPDSTGKLVMISASPIEIEGLNWACITKLDFEEAISLQQRGQDKDFFTQYRDGYQYEDLYLISAQGIVFYNVTHKADYRSNLLTGEYKDTGFGKLLEPVIEQKTFGFSDFSPYPPNQNRPSAFIAQPFVSENKVELVVALELSLNRINQIMGQRTGMGETGETILVGPDYLMRSDSYRDPAGHSVLNSFKNPETGRVDTPTIRAVIQRHETGFTTGERDYIDNKVLMAYAPLDVFDTTWNLTAKIDQQEAYKASKVIAFFVAMIIGIAVIVILILSWLIVRSITHPIKEVSAMLTDIAQGEGDLTRQLKVHYEDEIGDMANSFNVFVQKLREMIQDIAQKSQVVGSSSTELSAISDEMNKSSQDLSGNSHTVASAAEEMSANMNSVVTAMDETTSNVNTIASSTEEMSSTIDEIAKNSELASNVTQSAVAEAQSASSKITALNAAAQEITEVTETISAISKQTNLLALNATIEAASAGEAGKGFAVVAGEIKELARQTAQSTEDIRSKIDGIQNSTHETILEIGKITEIIDESNNLMNTIAAAVSEQSATIREIANNIANASQGLHEVNNNVMQSSSASGEVSVRITEVSQTAESISHNSEQINESVAELSRLAEDLNQLVGQFKT